MNIVRKASAGTMESSDAYVEIAPGEQGLEIELDSVVKAQFGEDILHAAKDVLAENGVSSARVRIVDRGALECVIRARVETAIVRGRENA